MEEMTAYLASDGYVDELLNDLADESGGTGSGVTVRDRLALVPGPPRAAAWAANVWLDPRWISIDSIGHGAAQLRDIQRNWFLYSCGSHRRAALIQAKLPHVSAKPHCFGDPAPTAPLGSWTLWGDNLILASPACTSPFPHGEVHFVENKVDPPNRAYLKLWELFTLLGVTPKPGELCLDLGSSPGGWSWVLHELGASVFSVDKAELAPSVARLPRVDHCQGSGFGLDPRMAGEVDWLFSDMACYPERLYTLIQRWLELGQCKRFVCTIKCQGDTDHATIRRFAEIPGSRLLHLSCNKHELTWVKL